MLEDIIHNSPANSLICIACDVTSPAGFIKTKSAQAWKTNPLIYIKDLASSCWANEFELKFNLHKFESTMQLKSFSFNPFQENTYLIWDEDGIGAIIDPGCYTFEERQELKTFVAKNKIQLKFI